MVFSGRICLRMHANKEITLCLLYFSAWKAFFASCEFWEKSAKSRADLMRLWVISFMPVVPARWRTGALRKAPLTQWSDMSSPMCWEVILCRKEVFGNSAGRGGWDGVRWLWDAGGTLQNCRACSFFENLVSKFWSLASKFWFLAKNSGVGKECREFGIRWSSVQLGAAVQMNFG